MSSVPQIGYICDQDAYAFSGQKCSAQSILVAHKNWIGAGILEEIQKRASSRNLNDLTVGPVLTWTTDHMLGHVEELLKIPGRLHTLQLGNHFQMVTCTIVKMNLGVST